MGTVVLYNQHSDVKLTHRQLIEGVYGCPLEEIEIDTVNDLLNQVLPVLEDFGVYYG